MKKIFLIILVLIISVSSKAQFIKAELKANGLTCSMCSLAIHKKLQKLDFVDSIGNNIDSSIFILYFKKGAEVNADLIKQKVEDAGFFVGSLIGFIPFQNTKVDMDYHLSYKSALYHFVNSKPSVLNGIYKLKFIDKGYVSDKDYKKLKKLSQGHSNHQMSSNNTIPDKVYHVILMTP